MYHICLQCRNQAHFSSETQAPPYDQYMAHTIQEDYLGKGNQKIVNRKISHVVQRLGSFISSLQSSDLFSKHYHYKFFILAQSCIDKPLEGLITCFEGKLFNDLLIQG